MITNEPPSISPAMKTRVDILRRACHVIALVQNGNDRFNWNRKTLSDSFAGESMPDNAESDVTPKQVGASIELLRTMGLPVPKGRGNNRINLTRELTFDEQMLILRFYMHQIVKEIGISDYLAKYIRNNKNRSLWMLARIYFASVDKSRVCLKYGPSAEPQDYIVHPYDWVYRSDAIYLVALREKDGVTGLFRLDRIREIDVMDTHFDEEVPDVQELFRYSLGAFIGNKTYDVVIEYSEAVRERVEEDFGHIELVTSAAGGLLRSSFKIADLAMLCRVVFPYCGAVHIVSPPEARDEMVKLLKGNMALYT